MRIVDAQATAAAIKAAIKAALFRRPGHDYDLPIDAPSIDEWDGAYDGGTYRIPAGQLIINGKVWDDTSGTWVGTSCIAPSPFKCDSYGGCPPSECRYAATHQTSSLNNTGGDEERPEASPSQDSGRPTSVLLNEAANLIEMSCTGGSRLLADELRTRAETFRAIENISTPTK